MTLFILLLVGAYLLGSISFAVLLSHLRRLPDPRSLGSGNPGASNMLRLGRRPLALATLLGDLGKGALAAGLGQLAGLDDILAAWLGLAAVVGHMLPVFHRWRGGKGVATAAGVLLVVSWPSAIFCLGFWLLLFAWQRIASLASICACLALLPWLAWMAPELFMPLGLMSLLILLRHQLNMRRLLRGVENHFRR
ncbi:glycerol-3-phosphate 1-O-acyltransferase PlsY [Halopseudomonas phragmitis]|uniref:Glycerol-3-phosphate acyltransferase n=1 Tax=Halopseudomonas phragmitis TaxID=1931241 RepID=A0A1V0BA30_9GAMM|nr:glycerol-3-phosphate 1-O-acyltransferase PlsY [Halopseudomonas phragmitis]AQZ96741.1 acyl-phosphate glycerol 3-phosphate acyltransferase [Halopseudomonas phragmitis]PAU88529.1 acyl-phosphate glycerol 3-phosphate acyltransferase [Pseudomonas sp. WN033]